MRKSIAILSLSALFMGSTAFPYVRTNGNDKQWSDIDAWANTTGEAVEKVPNGKDDQITLNFNFKSIYMDMDVTLNSLMFNRELGVAWRDMGKDPNANPTIYMGETVTDGDGLRDATLTLDLANKTANGYVLYPAHGTDAVGSINAVTYGEYGHAHGVFFDEAGRQQGFHGAHVWIHVQLVCGIYGKSLARRKTEQPSRQWRRFQIHFQQGPHAF